MTDSPFSVWVVFARSVRRLCIAVNALADASAMTDMRPAASSRPQESQAAVTRKATTQAAMTAMTDLSNAEMVKRFSITPQIFGLVEARMVNIKSVKRLGKIRGN